MSQKKRPKTNRTRESIREGLLVEKDKDFLSTSASKFNPIDVEALGVKFVQSTEDNVIPSFEGTVTDLSDFPEKYLLPKLRRRSLERHNFNVEKLTSITDKSVKTFVDKLHDTVQNGLLALETSETYTDTLMIHLLVRVVGLDDWPFKLKIHPPYNLYIEDEATVFAEPEFVIDNNKISVISVEDKHLKNVGPSNEFGELQIAGEILACANENIRRSGQYMDQTLFAIRVISTYFTFYIATIPADYWQELHIGLPESESVEIQRWPGENGAQTSLDIADPAGRKKIIISLLKIREFLLNSEEEVTGEAESEEGSGEMIE